MVRLYREARSGTLDAQKATKLAWLLKETARLIEAGEIEARLAELERRIDE